MPSLRFVAYALPLGIVALPGSRPAVRADRFDEGSSRHAFASTGRVSDPDEVALALTAAPTSLTAGAAVYTLRDGQFTKARDGSTGWACMVSRDPRINVVAPMCFDPEGARTLMQAEMLRTQLRSRGLSNTAIDREVDAAYHRGTLKYPNKSAVIYMMSSHQLLATYQGDQSHAVGQWHPHLMIYCPGASVEQFALGAGQQAGPLSIPFTDAGGVQLVVEVPHWADSPAMADAAGGGSR
jgi:hypothetical protein